MENIRQTIIDNLDKLSETQQESILTHLMAYIHENRHYSARELIKLPRELRNYLVYAALARADNEDFEIFEAYSEEDLE
jgi:hypothetical protein